VIGASHDLFCSEDKAYLYFSIVFSISHSFLPVRLDLTRARYAEQLRTAGVRVIYTQYSNSANGFFGSGLDESDEAMMEVVLFLAREIITGIRKLESS
jgi:hypothetical protein